MSSVTIESCDPREREAEIKALFARSDRPQFDAVFERAYRVRAASGMRSWIGRSGADAVMHIAVTPLPLVAGGNTLTAGILGDLMVEEAHRDFWAPVRLLRAMLAELKRDQQIDFLLTTTTADAQPVFKAAGFNELGVLRRYVLPLWRPYLLYARLRSGGARASASIGGAADPKGLDAIGRFLRTEFWRPQPNPEFYQTRADRAEFAEPMWLLTKRRDGSICGAALVTRNVALPEASIADIFWDADADAASVLHATARWARRRGFRRMTVTTVAGSALADQLLRAGFLARSVRSMFLMRQISGRPVPSLDRLMLPGFSLSSW
jgi:hypothetical protein